MTYDGKFIREEMARQRLSLKDFARKAGISSTTATAILRNGKATRIKTWGKVANALGIDPPSRVLLGDEEAVM